MKCNTCNSRWESTNKMNHCPFCNEDLLLENQINNYKITMEELVDKHSADVYLKTEELLTIVADNFFEEMGRLLAIIIKFDGAKQIFNLKNENSDNFDLEFNKVLENISNSTFIAKDVLKPAIHILCAGLKLTLTDTQSSLSFNKNNNDIKVILVKYSGQSKEVVIPDAVTAIGENAFRDCNHLMKVTIPNTCTSIGESAFNYCNQLYKVNIPSSVTFIGDEAFYECSQLTKITIPNSVTSIGQKAFYYCNQITKLTIPSSVTTIGDDAFYGCSSLPQAKKDQIKTINANAIR